MLNVSSAFKNALANDWRKYLISATITLQDNTVLTITNEDLMATGNNIEDGLCDDSSFGALGGTPIGSITLNLNNVDESYSTFDFTRARVVLQIGLKFEDDTVEMINRGVYFVDTPTYTATSVSLYCLDNMYRLDYPYDSDLVYPASLGAIVQDICTEFGLTLNTQNFPQNSFVVNESPANGQTTYREVLSWCAEIAGCYARCDVSGGIIFGWYDQTILEDYYDDDDESRMIPLNSISEQNLGLDDIIITGVVLNREEEETTTVTQTLPDGTVITYDQTSPVIHTYTYGTIDYAIELNGKNGFITATNAQSIVDRIGAQLTGIRYRKANVSHLSLPYIQAGDIALLTDRKGNKHVMLITRTVFTFGSYQQTASAGKTVAQNSSVQYSALTKQYSEARQEIYKEVQARQEAVAELAAKIAESGTGLYATQVETPPGSGSYIYYYHNKPELADSDIQLVFSTVGFTVTANGTDPNPTWYGLTVDGQLIASILNTTGVNADWINTGQLSVHKTVGSTEVEMLFVDCDTGTVRISDQVQAIDDARKVATNYLTYNANVGLDVGYNGTSAKTRITGGGVEIFDENGDSSAEFSASGVRVGDGLGSRTEYSSNGVEIFNENNVSIANFTASGERIGVADGAHVEITSGKTDFYDNNNLLVGSISANTETTTTREDSVPLNIVYDSVSDEYVGTLSWPIPGDRLANTDIKVEVNGETGGTSYISIEFGSWSSSWIVSENVPTVSDTIIDGSTLTTQLGTLSVSFDGSAVTVVVRYINLGASTWGMLFSYSSKIAYPTYQFGNLDTTRLPADLGFETGEYTLANGRASSTFGIKTIATEEAQMVIGKWNWDGGTFYCYNPIFIIGDGSSAISRHNTFEIGSGGDAYLISPVNSTVGARLTLQQQSQQSRAGSTVPSEIVKFGDILMCDSEGCDATWIGSRRTTSDYVYTAYETHRPMLSPSLEKHINGFYQRIDALGNPSITFDSNATRNAWVNALGMGTVQVKNGNSTNVATATDTTLCNSGSLSAGTYIIKARVQFAASSSGRRVIFLSTSSTGSFVDRYTRLIVAPSPSSYTEVELTYLTTITSATTYYLRAYQNSGSTLACTGGIEYVKLR